MTQMDKMFHYKGIEHTNKKNTQNKMKNYQRK